MYERPYAFVSEEPLEFISSRGTYHVEVVYVSGVLGFEWGDDLPAEVSQRCALPRRASFYPSRYRLYPEDRSLHLVEPAVCTLALGIYRFLCP